MTESKQQWELAVYDQRVKQSFVEMAGEKNYLREIILAYQIVKGSESLQKCSTESIRSAIINVALVGATLNPALQQAFLVPRKGKACLDISFRGMVKIATGSGVVLDIDATVVYDKDKFFYEQGLNPILNHIPSLDDDHGKFKFVYAIATLANGIKKFIVLNEQEIEKVKATSAARSGPWIDWYEEMARKTAVKKLFKLLPATETMAYAVSVVNEHEGLEKEPSNAEKLQERFKPQNDVQDAQVVEEVKSMPVEEKQQEDTKTEEKADKPPFTPVKIKLTKIRSGVTKDKKGNDKPWKIYDIVDENNVIYSTFSETIGVLAENLRISGKPCTIIFTTGDHGNNIVEIKE